MKSRLVLILFVALAALTAQSSLGQQPADVDGHVVDRPPKYNAEQRLELARKLFDLKGDDDRSFRLLYLDRHPELIPDDVLIRLLKTNDEMTPRRALTAFRRTSTDNTELRKRILHIVFEELQVAPVTVYSFSAMYELARRAGDESYVRRAELIISDYYQARMGRKLLENMANSNAKYSDGSFRNVRSMLFRFAPADFRSEYADESHSPLWLIVLDESRSPVDTLAELRGISKLEFEDKHSFCLSTASQLGLVAQLDCPRALEWADQAPERIAKIWGKLVIAPALSRTDPAASKDLVKECYRQLGEFRQSSGDSQNYYYPSSRIAAMGLPLVAEVDPALLPECVNRTIATAHRLEESLGTTCASNTSRSLRQSRVTTNDKPRQCFGHMWIWT